MRRACALAGALAAILAMATASSAAAKVQLGRTAVVRPLSGTVRVKAPGSNRYKVLAARATIKMGSTVDATRGRVRVVTARNFKGDTQAGTFYDGAFVLTQARAARAFTDLRLVRGDFGKCASASARGRVAASRRVVRRLWGNARGRFRTRGRFSAATVRGTVWLTTDFCDTSRTESRQGIVVASSTVTQDAFTSRVTAGANYELKPGQSLEVHCDDVAAPYIEIYCMLLLSQPADNIFGFGLLLRNTPQEVYGLCLTGPAGQSCGDFPLTPPDEHGFRFSAVVCRPGQGPGEYTATWFVNGVVLPVPIRFTSVRPREDLFCLNNP
jgi:hypothetical protein